MGTPNTHHCSSCHTLACLETPDFKSKEEKEEEEEEENEKEENFSGWAEKTRREAR